MPTRPFNVNIYEVVVRDYDNYRPLPFEEAIECAWQQPLSERHRSEPRRSFRLEHMCEAEDYYVLNFAALQYEGPGRADTTHPVSSIGLNPGELFAYETAMLYDIEHSILFVESHQTSMRSGAIARYFTHFADTTAYGVYPRFDEDVIRRARGFIEIRNVGVRAAVQRRDDRESGLDVHTATGREFEAEYVDLMFSMNSRKRSLSKGPVWSFLNQFINGEDHDDIKRLILRGREHEGDKLEKLDLFRHRERRERLVAVGAGNRRVDHEVRWRELEEIREGYSS